MSWTQAAGVILGSGVVAALLNQLFEGLRLDRQLKHERRLRLDDMRRVAYFDYVMYFKRLPQRLVDGLVSYTQADEARINEIARHVNEEAKAVRTSLSFCASDRVTAVVDGKQDAALNGFTGAGVVFAGDLSKYAEDLNAAAAQHLSPYLTDLLDAMAVDFRV